MNSEERFIKSLSKGFEYFSKLKEEETLQFRILNLPISVTQPINEEAQNLCRELGREPNTLFNQDHEQTLASVMDFAFHLGISRINTSVTSGGLRRNYTRVALRAIAKAPDTEATPDPSV